VPKPSSRLPKPTGGKPVRRPTERRLAADDGERTAAKPAVRDLAEPISDPMRLAAEVEALKTELELVRAKVRELEAVADVDPLLDILNRRGFERELARSLAYVKRYGPRAALLYLDLDGFKAVNDTFGHAAGDRMLEAVAAALVRHVRASDVVARLGGDEFAVLLWNAGEADAARKAESIEALIAGTRIRWQDAMLAVGASVGVAMLRAADSPAAVLDRADRAMYARKAARGLAVTAAGGAS
jgi:diguanylate cyclase (GGDEF)-like protein